MYRDTFTFDAHHPSDILVFHCGKNDAIHPISFGQRFAQYDEVGRYSWPVARLMLQLFKSQACLSLRCCDRSGKMRSHRFATYLRSDTGCNIYQYNQRFTAEQDNWKDTPGLSCSSDAGSIERSHLNLPGRVLTGGLAVFALVGKRSRSPCPACADGIRWSASLCQAMERHLVKCFAALLQQIR